MSRRVLVTMVAYLVSVSSIEEGSRLLQFGPDSGDLRTPRGDDGSSGAVQIDVEFPYFGVTYPSLYVNVNGGISFKKELNQFTPDDFPLSSSPPIIVAFWADVNTDGEGRGDVWYRETRNSTILDLLTQWIRCTAFSYVDFRADWAFLATWHDVAFFAASMLGLEKRNTFQAILALDSNTKSSFVVLIYDKLEWTTGAYQSFIHPGSGGDEDTGLGGVPAVAGFDAGDNSHYSAIPGSKTDRVLHLTNTSNAGLPGMWIFKIDSDQILLEAPRVPPSVSGSVVSASGEVLVQENIQTDVTCGAEHQRYMGGATDSLTLSVNTSITCQTFLPGRHEGIDVGDSHNVSFESSIGNTTKPQSKSSNSIMSGRLNRYEKEKCSCIRAEASGCYTTRDDVIITSAYGPDDVIIIGNHENSTQPGNVTYNICPSISSGIVVECSVVGVYPGADIIISMTSSYQLIELEDKYVKSYLTSPPLHVNSTGSYSEPLSAVNPRTTDGPAATLLDAESPNHTSSSSESTIFRCRSGSKVCTQHITPTRGGHYNVRCTAVNSAFHNIRRESEPLLLLVHEPPKTFPTLTINDQEFIGDRQNNIIHVQENKIYNVHCRIEGGFPSTATVYAECAGIPLDNDTFVFRRDMTFAECKCRGYHLSGCYMLETKVTVQVVYGPEYVKMDIESLVMETNNSIPQISQRQIGQQDPQRLFNNSRNTPATDDTLCPSTSPQPSTIKLRCSVAQIFPAAKFSLDISPPGGSASLASHHSEVCSSEGKVCTYSFVPSEGGNYTFRCLAQNTIYGELRLFSKPFSVFVTKISLLPPTLIIDGRNFTGRHFNSVNVVENQVYNITCHVHSGMPALVKVSIECAGIPSNGTFKLTKITRSSKCICRVIHLNGCFDLQTEVSVSGLFDSQYSPPYTGVVTSGAVCVVLVCALTVFAAMMRRRCLTERSRRNKRMTNQQYLRYPYQTTYPNIGYSYNTTYPYQTPYPYPNMMSKTRHTLSQPDPRTISYPYEMTSSNLRHMMTSLSHEMMTENLYQTCTGRLSPGLPNQILSGRGRTSAGVDISEIKVPNYQ